MTTPAEAALERLGRARFVADYWRKHLLDDPNTRWAAHPLCMVLAALDGETDPTECGIGPDGAAEFAALTEGSAGD